MLQHKLTPTTDSYQHNDNSDDIYSHNNAPQILSNYLLYPLPIYFVASPVLFPHLLILPLVGITGSYPVTLPLFALIPVLKTPLTGKDLLFYLQPALMLSYLTPIGPSFPAAPG